MACKGAPMGSLCGKGEIGTSGSRHQVVYAWPAESDMNGVELRAIDLVWSMLVRVSDHFNRLVVLVGKHVQCWFQCWIEG